MSKADKEDGAISGLHCLAENLGFPSRAQGMGKGKKGGDLYPVKVIGLSEYQRERKRAEWSLRSRHAFLFPHVQG